YGLTPDQVVTIANNIGA
ncbi:hypothetical protein, partial [Xanthomonas translucens]